MDGLHRLRGVERQAEGLGDVHGLVLVDLGEGRHGVDGPLRVDVPGARDPGGRRRVVGQGQDGVVLLRPRHAVEDRGAADHRGGDAGCEGPEPRLEGAAASDQEYPFHRSPFGVVAGVTCGAT